MSEPNLKKRRLSDLADIDGDESKDSDTTTKTNGTVLLSNLEKINYLGSSSIFDGSEVFDIIGIKNELNELCNTDHGRSKVLSLYHQEMKKHALGVNNMWKKQKNKNNKIVQVKQRGVFAHITWAAAVKADGGASTRYTPLEIMGVINACALTVYKWKELNCRPDLGFTHSANVSKAFRMYVIIMYITKFGFRFPQKVRSRTFESFHKKVKGMAEKKNPDPDSIQLRTAITTAPFDIVKNVVTNS